MSKSLGNSLPARALDYLHVGNAARDNTVIFLLTSDPSGFPHVALLSPFQVVTTSDREFMLAVHKGTKSQHYLEENRKATLIVQASPSVDYIKFQATRVEGWVSKKDEILYRAEPVDVLEDYSDMAPYVSQLKFDPRKILEDYSAGFEEIKKYIRSH